MSNIEYLEQEQENAERTAQAGYEEEAGGIE